MSHLIPTVRTDKNGRNVIRHMKQDVSVARGSTIPAPPALKADACAALVDKALLTITMVVYNGSPTEDERNVLESGLLGLSADTLHRIIELDSAENYIRLWVISDDLKRGVGCSFTTDYLHLYEMLSHRGIDKMTASDYIRGFQQYEELCPLGDDGTYPEERFDQCAAITDVTRIMIEDELLDGDGNDVTYIDGNGEWTPFLRDRKMRKLLLDSQYDRSRVVDLVKERKLTSADDLMDILDQDGKALADGAL